MELNYNLGTLKIIYPQLDEYTKSLLLAVEECLKRIEAGQSPDISSLRKVAQESIEKTTSALNIIGLNGAEKYFLLIQECIDELSLDTEKNKKLLDVINDNLATGVFYLKNLVEGKFDEPTRLFTSYKALADIIGKSVNIADLFYPKLQLSFTHKAKDKARQLKVGTIISAKDKESLISFAKEKQKFLKINIDSIKASSADVADIARNTEYKNAIGIVKGFAEELRDKMLSPSVFITGGVLALIMEFYTPTANTSFQKIVKEDGLDDLLEGLGLLEEAFATIQTEVDGVATGARSSAIKMGDEFAKRLILLLVKTVQKSPDYKFLQSYHKLAELFSVDFFIKQLEEVDFRLITGAQKRRDAIIPLITELKEDVGAMTANGASDASIISYAKKNVNSFGALTKILPPTTDLGMIVNQLKGLSDNIVTDINSFTEGVKLEFTLSVALLDYVLVKYIENGELDEDTNAEVKLMVTRLSNAMSGVSNDSLDIPSLGASEKFVQERKIIAAIYKEVLSELTDAESKLSFMIQNSMDDKASISKIVASLEKIHDTLMMLESKSITSIIDSVVDVLKSWKENGLKSLNQEDIKLTVTLLSGISLFAQAYSSYNFDGAASLQQKLIADFNKNSKKKIDEEVDEHLAQSAEFISPISEESASALDNVDFSAVVKEAQEQSAVDTSISTPSTTVSSVSTDNANTSVSSTTSDVPKKPKAIIYEKDFVATDTLNEEQLELIDDFKEEVNEIVGNVDVYVKKLSTDNANVAIITDLRRAFHTLKGSGRMVGLEQLGNVAYVAEERFNTLLASQSPSLTAERIAIAQTTAHAIVDKINTLSTDNTSVEVNVGELIHNFIDAWDGARVQAQEQQETQEAEIVKAVQETTIADALGADADVEFDELDEKGEVVDEVHKPIDNQTDDGELDVDGLFNGLGVEDVGQVGELSTSVNAVSEADIASIEQTSVSVKAEDQENVSQETFKSEKSEVDDVSRHSQIASQEDGKNGVGQQAQTHQQTQQSQGVYSGVVMDEATVKSITQQIKEEVSKEFKEALASALKDISSSLSQQITERISTQVGEQVNVAVQAIQQNQQFSSEAVLNAVQGVQTQPAISKEEINDLIKENIKSYSSEIKNAISSMGESGSSASEELLKENKALKELAASLEEQLNNQRSAFEQLVHKVDRLEVTVKKKSSKRKGNELSLGDKAQAEELRTEQLQASSKVIELLKQHEHLLELFDDSIVELKNELDSDMYEIARDEIKELFEAIRESSQNLVIGQEVDVAKFKRDIHTVKGSLRMCGNNIAGAIAHRLESVLDYIESRQLSLLDFADMIDGEVKKMDFVNENADKELTQEQMAWLAHADFSASEEGGGELAVGEMITSSTDSDNKNKSSQVNSIKVPSKHIDGIIKNINETRLIKGSLEETAKIQFKYVNDVRSSMNKMQRLLKELEIATETQHINKNYLTLASEKDADFDTLEFDRYTKQQESINLISEVMDDVLDSVSDLENSNKYNENNIIKQSVLLENTMDTLIDMRLVSIDTVVDKFYKIVRLVCKDANKVANFKISGEKNEIDKVVLDRMQHTIEHIIRNSVTHGIEPEEIRIAKGKPKIGTIGMDVSVVGSLIVFDIYDDGAGIDVEKIRKKGIEKSLIQEGVDYTEDDLLELIFKSGFSTADVVSQNAGRGVGMDVVKSEVSALGGSIFVKTEKDKGTHFVISLPLSIVSNQAMITSANGKLVAIPSVFVDRVVALNKEQLVDAYENGYMIDENNKVKVFDVCEITNNGSLRENIKPTNTVIISKYLNEIIALHVDNLKSSEEIIIKSVGSFISKVNGIVGVTVLSSGDFSVVINPILLSANYRKYIKSSQEVELVIHSPGAKKSTTKATSKQAAKRKINILVVDDSITIRKATKKFLDKHDFVVDTAKDGEDAFNKINANNYDVVLSDVEMPVMDGFELVKAIRASEDERIKSLPIMMITSRTADKHKNYAYSLGANAYVGKPFKEDEVLSFVNGVGQE